MSPDLPVPDQTDLAVQNNTTGAVDYLQFTGTTLTSSEMFDYGLGAGFNIVGGAHMNIGPSAGTTLIAQNTAGIVDFLGLDPDANLVSSATLSSPLPHIVGSGLFGQIPGQNGPTLVTQLPNGELDILGFNGNGQLLASDLIGNTVGFAPVIGVADTQYGDTNRNAFSGVGSNPNVLLQLPDGSIDAVGFLGSFINDTLSFSSSFLLPGSAGSPALQAINSNGNNGSANFALGESGNSFEGEQMIGQLANGSFDALYVDSGFGGSTHEGDIYASEQLNLSMRGWHAINDAGGVVQGLFPFK